MNEKFTAEEMRILKCKGWDIEAGDTEANVGGLSKLHKCNGQFHRFEWRPSEYEDAEGHWSEWADFTYAKIEHVEDFNNHTD